MSNPEPSIRINVDVSNPGQFFACCGLLELADRLWPGAEGWFERRQFLIESKGDLSQLVKTLKEGTVSSHTDEGEPSICPVHLDRFDLKLRWWIRDDWSRFKNKPKEYCVRFMKTELKFWSGNQSSRQIIDALLKAILIPTTATSLDYFKPSGCLSSRFGLDSGPAWTALDVGFSINEHPIGVKSSAAVELLAAIGLQRCRPLIHEQGIDYATWKDRIQAPLLSAAVCGQISALGSTKYRTRVIDRGSYAALDRSNPIRQGVSHE